MIRKIQQYLDNWSLAALIPVSVGPLLLFAEPLLTGKALFWGLPALQFIPWRAYAFESLRQGSLPGWNVLNGMGAPLLANYQLAIYYPPSWLVYLFAAIGGIPWMAWAHTLLVVMHLAWAGAGLVFALRSYGISRTGQAVAGLAFALCGYFTARNGVFPMIWTGAWLPWLIYTSRKIAAPVPESGAKTTFLQLPLVLSLAMMLLAGHAQLAWYAILLLTAWVITWSWRSGAKSAGTAVLRLAAAGLAAGFLAAAQLIPTAEFLLQSQRSASVDYTTAMTYSFWPWRFLTLFAPEMFGNPGLGDYWGYASYWEDAVYIGLLPLFLAGTATYSLIRKKKRDEQQPRLNRLVVFLLILTVAGFLLALGKNTPLFPFLYQYVPTFQMFQAPARFLILVELALAMLAGIGLDAWKKPGGRALDWLKRSVVAFVAVMLAAGIAKVFLPGVEGSFVRAVAMAGLWGTGAGLLAVRTPPAGEKKRRDRWSLAVITWVLLDLLAAGWALHPSVPVNFYAANPAGEQSAAANGVGRVYLSQDEEYRLKFSRFFRFTDFRALEDWRHLRVVGLPNINLLDGQSSANNFDPLVPSRYARLINYVESLTFVEQQQWLRLMGVDRVTAIDIYHPSGIQQKPVGAAVRWYYTACPVFVEGEQTAWEPLWERVSRLQPGEQIDWAVIEAPAQGQPCKKGVTASIDLLTEQSDQVSLRVTSGEAGWLVLADTWYPGWIAEVDGIEQPIMRANWNFRAVSVAPGEHVVVFKFAPVSIRIGLWLSAIGILILAVALATKRRSHV